MLPLTLLAANKLLNLLTVNDALSQAISSNAALNGIAVPNLATQQIMSSYVTPDMGDLNLQLTLSAGLRIHEPGFKYPAREVSGILGYRDRYRGRLV